MEADTSPYSTTDGGWNKLARRVRIIIGVHACCTTIGALQSEHSITTPPCTDNEDLESAAIKEEEIESADNELAMRVLKLCCTRSLAC